ncbi:MAG: hypothetical protein H0V76_01760 [Blastocatellia bacterium]|nr:hypothetical protein [Blastocatellia bacterium]
MSFLLLCSATAAAQAPAKPAPAVSNGAQGTPAYAEILLKSTAVEAELESLLLDYTEDFPRVKELKYEHGLLEKEKSRLKALKPDQVSKLSLALGRLIVQRVELETDLWKLSENYKEEHPDVRRVKRKLEIYQKAIAEIMG